MSERLQGTSICLVTMNKPTILQTTVDALRASLTDPYEVIVVDNGSTDQGTIGILDSMERMGWKVLRSTSNEGLSRATNRGLAAGKYDCLIHLDDDAVISTVGWNEMMRHYLVTFNKVGLVVPSSTREFIQHDGYREIRWGLGMNWAIRASLFEDIGGYDPQLVHQNECDLAIRVRMTGYHVAGIQSFVPHHNDPGGPRSDLALAREHLGVVQFRDKWVRLFFGRDYNYGTTPLRLMTGWPPDEEWFRRFAESHGVELNPQCPENVDTSPGSVLGLTADTAQNVGPRRLSFGGGQYMAYVVLRSDYAFWERGDGYEQDRRKAILRWYELTGEKYRGYHFPHDPLRVE